MSVLGIETTGAISLLPRQVCVTDDEIIQNYLFPGASFKARACKCRRNTRESRYVFVPLCITTSFSEWIAC